MIVMQWMKLRISLICSSLTILSIAVARADTDPAVVVVTATRIGQSGFDLPVSIDRLGGRHLQDGQLQVNLSESLARVPGIVAQNRQNYAQDLQISSRGFGARASFGVRGLRIYSDGIPATMPDGQGQVSHIDLGSAARIEVMRGPFSALYGNSSGGVIAVFTEDGAPGTRIEPSILLGSDGTQRYSTKVSGDTGRFNYVADLARFRTDGYRDHSAAKRDNLNTKLRWTLDNGSTLMLVANAVDMPDIQDPLGLTRAQFDANPRQATAVAYNFNTRKSVAQQQLGVAFEQEIGADDTVHALLYRGNREAIQFQSIPVAVQAPASQPGGVIDLGREYWGLDLRWTRRMQLAGAPLTATVGINYDYLDEERKGFQNFVGTQTGVLGALRRNENNRLASFDQYLQMQWEPSERWLLMGGFRNSSLKLASSDRYVVAGNGDDSGSTQFAVVTGSFGATFRAAEALNLYAAIGKGFETPTMNELSYRPGGALGLNFELQPAKSNNVEIGVKTQLNDAIQLNAALFTVDTEDEIVVDTNVGGRTTFRNGGRTHRNGLEIGAEGRWKTGFGFAAAFTQLDAHYRDSLPGGAIAAGNAIPGIPQTSLFVEGSWRHHPSGFVAAIDLRRVAKVWVNDANTDAAGAYTVSSLRIGLEQKSSGLTFKEFLRIDNLGNAKYSGSVVVNEGNSRFFEPAPGRSYLFGVTVSYGF